MVSRFSLMLSLAAFVAAVAAAAAFGAAFGPGPWYEALAKPSWNPPNAVFGPVWTILYVMIAVAGWLAWRRTGFGTPFAIWCVALVLNAIWSWLFFGRQSIAVAFMDILALWCAIVAFVLVTRRTSPAASWLFVPYLGWVTFAAALNFAILQLNP